MFAGLDVDGNGMLDQHELEKAVAGHHIQTELPYQTETTIFILNGRD